MPSSLSLRAAVFLSTPSARRATNVTTLNYPRIIISIHALREEGDHTCHPPHLCIAQFLSTPSARRATILATLLTYALRNFYPRPPRGGRPGALVCKISSGAISIHALREEGDDILVADFINGTKFLSTPSARRATDVRVTSVEKITYFYPRPPRGGRPAAHGVEKVIFKFLSTPSARRATLVPIGYDSTVIISIHALREEGDCGQLRHQLLQGISIHALREEGDDRFSASISNWRYFYPRPPRGGRLFF